MSDQDLQYSLTVFVDDADKKMEALFSKWEKRAEGIGTSLSKGMSEGASKGKGADAAAKGLDAVGNSATSAEKALARMEKQEQALWAASDKLDASLRKQAEAFRSLGNSGAAAEVEKLRAALMDAANMDKANIGKGTLLPTANVDAFIASNKLLIQGYSEDIKAQKEVAKTSEETHASRIATAQKLNDTEKLIRAEKYAGNAAYQAEVVASHQRTAAALNTILQNSAGKSKAQIEQEISAVMRLESAKIKSAQAAAQAQQNSLFASATAMNKAVMGVYAVQQAVEDYSYAGIRGAANNMAMLAAMIGGSTGIVAMFGLLTLNIAESSGALDGFAQALGMTWIKTKEQNDELKSFIENIDRLQKLQYDYEKKQADFNPVDKKNADLEQQKAELQAAIDLDKERANNADSAVRAYQRMLEISKEMGSWAKIHPFWDAGFKNESPKNILDNQETINREFAKTYGNNMYFEQKKEKLKGMLDEMNALQKQFEQASGMSVSEEAFNKVTENQEKFNNGLDESVSSMRQLNEQLDIMKKAGIDPKELEKLQKAKLSSAYDPSSSAVGKNLRSAFDSLNTQLEEKRVELLQKQNEENIKAAGNEQKKVEIAREYSNQLELQYSKFKAIGESTDKSAQTADEKLKKLEAETKEIEKQINATQKIIDNNARELQQIEDRKAAWADSEAKRKAAALDKIDDLKTSEKQAQIEDNLKNGPQGLEWAKKMNESYQQNADNWSKMQKAMGADHHAVDSYINNWKKATQQNYEDYVEKLQKQAEADKLAAEKAGEASKQKRLNELKEKLGGSAQDKISEASQLQDAGKFEMAKQKLEQAEKALKELHDAQQKAVGKGTADQSIQAEKDMENTSKKLDKLYDQMAKLQTQEGEWAGKQQEVLQQQLQKTTQEKEKAAQITMINPAEVGTIEAINAALQGTLAIMEAIAAVQAISGGSTPSNLGPAGAAAGAAGGAAAGAAGGTTINQHITTNLAGGSPLAASLAATAAAQNLLIMKT